MLAVVFKDDLSPTRLFVDTGKGRKGKKRSKSTAVVVQVMVTSPKVITTSSCFKLHPGIQRWALFHSRVVLTLHQTECLVHPESIQAPFRNHYPVHPG